MPDEFESSMPLFCLACGRPRTQVDVRNPRVLASHLACAAVEMPLDCSAAQQHQAQPQQAITASGARDAALFGVEHMQVMA